MTDIKPELHTPQEDWSGPEKAKLATKGLTVVIRDINSPANLAHQFRDTSFEDLPDVAETLAKSYGIYTDFNRATTGDEKEWMYMFRIAIPSGGPINARQWAILDDIARKYTASDTYTGTMQPSLRLTTRQAIQLHWVKKKDVVPAMQEIASSGFYTLNGCGDNVRNFMACPLSHYSKYFDGGRLRREGREVLPPAHPVLHRDLRDRPEVPEGRPQDRERSSSTATGSSTGSSRSAYPRSTATRRRASTSRTTASR